MACPRPGALQQSHAHPGAAPYTRDIGRPVEALRAEIVASSPGWTEADIEGKIDALHKVSREAVVSVKEEGLCLHADLKDTHALHIKPVTSLRMRNADEHGIARGAAYHRPHPVHVDSQRTYGIGCAAARTGCLGERHFKGEDLLQDAPGRVAIQFVLHHASPVFSFFR